MRIVTLAALLLALPVALTLAAGTRDRPPSSSAPAQPAPVAVLSNMRHYADSAAYQRVHAYIEKESGVSFTYEEVPDAQSYTERLSAALASREPIDLFRVGNKVDLARRLAQGAIREITDELDAYGQDIRKLFDDPPGWGRLPRGAMWKCVTIGGKVWAIPSATSARTGVVLQIRKDWRVRLGLPPVTTIDELETFLRKVRTADLDGNGRNDTVPYLDLYGDAPLEGTASTLTYAFTGASGWMHGWYNPTYLTADGGIAPTVLHPRFTDFLKRMRRWYADGLLYREVLSSNAAHGNELVAANRVAAVSSWYSDFYDGWARLALDVPGADYEIAILKGVDGSPARFTLNDPASPGWAYTAWSGMARWGITLQNWLAITKDNYIAQDHGQPGVDWTWADKDRNLIRKTRPLYAFDLLGFSPWNGVPTGPVVSFRVEKEVAANDYLGTQEGTWWPDWFLAYDWSGTPVQKNYDAAVSLINEAISRYIVGTSGDDGWRRAVTEFRRTWADEFSRQATALYKESL